jgi:hypothetical protein
MKRRKAFSQIRSKQQQPINVAMPSNDDFYSFFFFSLAAHFLLPRLEQWVSAAVFTSSD